MNFEVGEKRTSERGRLRARGARGSARVRSARRSRLGASPAGGAVGRVHRAVAPAGAEGDSYAPHLRQESPPRNFAWDFFFSFLILNLPAPSRLH